MTIPIRQQDSAELKLGASSLEMVRGKLIQRIYANPKLSRRQRRRIVAELDDLIADEKVRRRRLVTYQWQQEELEHRLIIAQKRIDIIAKYVTSISKFRLHEARTERIVSRYERDSAMCRVDVIERLLQIKAKYRPSEHQDDYHKVMLKIKRQQKVSEAREQAALDSIAKRAKFRAVFIEKVHDEFPEMAEEIIDYYDQQIFQRGPGG